MSDLRKALKMDCTFTIAMERGTTTILVIARRGEAQFFVQSGVAELGYLNEFEQLEVAATAALRLLAEKSAQQAVGADPLPPH